MLKDNKKSLNVNLKDMLSRFQFVVYKCSVGIAILIFSCCLFALGVKVDYSGILISISVFFFLTSLLIIHRCYSNCKSLLDYRNYISDYSKEKAKQFEMKEQIKMLKIQYKTDEKKRKEQST